MKQTMTAAIYARVSTDDQKCDLQLTELRAYAERMGWPVVEYMEKASGKAGVKRPQLERLLTDARLRKFDVVLVWKLDRFGRSLRHLVENIQVLDSAGVRFIAPNQNIDTDVKSPMGRFLIHIFAAFAEFEHSLIVERTVAGQAEAKRQGKHCGRPFIVFRRDLAVEMRLKGRSWREIAHAVQQDASTVRRAVSKALAQRAKSVKLTKDK